MRVDMSGNMIMCNSKIEEAAENGTCEGDKIIFVRVAQLHCNFVPPATVALRGEYLIEIFHGEPSQGLFGHKHCQQFAPTAGIHRVKPRGQATDNGIRQCEFVLHASGQDRVDSAEKQLSAST